MIRWAIKLISIIIFIIPINQGIDLLQPDDGSVLIQADEIMSKMINNIPVSYYNKTIIGDLNLRELHETSSPIQIFSCTFLGSIDSANVAFAGPVYFGKSTFREECNFTGAKFHQSAIFDNIDFSSESIFIDAEFRDRSRFVMTTFHDDANFGRCKFHDSIFKKAEFRDNATFSLAEFFGELNMEETNFQEDAFFIGPTIHENADFQNSKFNKMADFHDASFHGDAVFTSAQFNETAIFHEAVFDEIANFENAIFLGQTNFRRVDFQGDSIFWEADFTTNSLSLDEIKFTRFIVRWEDLKDSLLFNEIVYSALIKNFKDLGRIGDANNCYYEYMNNRQKDDVWDSVTSGLAYLSCGYGVRPIRTILICVSLILLFGYAYRKQECIERPNKSPIDDSSLSLGQRIQRSYYLQCLLFSATVFVASKPEKISLAKGCGYLVTIERILGWFFFALFVGVLIRTMIG